MFIAAQASDAAAYIQISAKSQVPFINEKYCATSNTTPKTKEHAEIIRTLLLQTFNETEHKAKERDKPHKKSTK